MNRTTSLLIAAAGALGLAGCASGDDETAASTTEVVVGAASASDAASTTDAPVTSETTPVETTAPPETSAPEPPPTSAPEPPPTAAPGGDFCDELRAFLTAWVDDEIGPADLTPLYASLAAIAPPELVEPLKILEEDNAILVDTLDSGQIDEAAYFAAGEQLAAYAEDECGIALEEL